MLEKKRLHLSELITSTTIRLLIKTEIILQMLHFLNEFLFLINGILSEIIIVFLRSLSAECTKIVGEETFAGRKNIVVAMKFTAKVFIPKEPN
ncbi:hypothetical protein D3C72_1323450 [compost metagenome]